MSAKDTRTPAAGSQRGAKTDEIVVVLPEFSSAGAELSSEQLETVAGGTGCTSQGGMTVIICIGQTCVNTRND